MRIAVVALFLISTFLLGYLPVKDTDFGWHYRCGREFLTSGNLCLQNNFSYLLPNYKSFYSSLLYDISLATIYDRFGFIGLSFIGAILFALSAFFVFHLLPGLLVLRMAAFYVIFLFSTVVFNLGLRSQIITYLFFVIILFLSEKARHNGAKHLFSLPLLFLVWVNTHIGFFIGLILLTLLLTEQLIKNIVERTKENFMKSTSLLVISLACFVATLINPFGINVYVGIFNHLSSPLSKMIAEWVPPPLWLNLLMSFLTVAMLIVMFRQKTLSVFSLLSLLFFYLLALYARRNLPFFYTIFSFYLFNNCPSNYVVAKLNFSKRTHDVILPLAISATVLILALPRVFRTIHFSTSWQEYCNKGLVVYPCDASVKLADLSGNVFSMYEWGGFLIWQHPRLKIFVDGRMPAWKDENGESPYEVFLSIIQTRDGWNEKLAKFKTDYLLIRSGTFLDFLLREKASSYGWQEDYRDQISVFYKKVQY